MVDLTPGSPEWCRRVSPSKAAAILAASPFESQRAMWHMMRGEAPWPEESEPMERGNLCEGAVLAWWRKHHDHTEWREQVTLTIGDWLVATPDAICETPDGLVCVQAKTTNSYMEKDGWGDPGTDVVPTHVLVQVYLEMEVAHRNRIPVVAAHIPVLGGYRNLFSNYVVEYDAAIGADLMVRMEAWRDSLAGDEPPELDDSVSTYDAVRKVHKDIDPDASVELSEQDARRLVEWDDELKSTKKSLLLAKSTVLDRMGRAQYAVHNGVRIARRQKHGDDVRFVVIAKPADLTQMEQAS